jgi:hypothetical protein
VDSEHGGAEDSQQASSVRTIPSQIGHNSPSSRRQFFAEIAAFMAVHAGHGKVELTVPYEAA